MDNRERLLNWAFWLAILTIAYNIVEGIVSIGFGINDETLSLLGFGVDSLVEVISGTGILHMVIKLRRTGDDSRDLFERNALKITGTAFMVLTAGLIIGSIVNIIYDHTPSTTLPGIIISSISILTMYFLMKYKLIIGKKLESDAIIADALCTRTCFYLSIILLVASLSYEFFKIPYIDIAGSLGIAYFAFREGLEAFQKARGLNCSCDKNCHPV